MRCKHVKDIIQDVREDSENLDVEEEFGISDRTFLRHINPVSYTHLTLPTIYSV